MTIIGNKYWEEHGDTIIEPFEPDHIQPNGIDLRLANKLIDYNNLGKIDSKNKIPHGKTLTCQKNSGFVLKPHSFYLGTTYEEISIPPSYIGKVEGRSSVGRLGVTVHVTAGFIDTGFKGHVTLELANLSNNEVVVYPMQRVCQLVFENCICTDKLYNGKYQDQIMPQPSLINFDKD